MIFYKIVNYGDRFYTDVELVRNIRDTIESQVLSTAQPIFMVYYFVRDYDHGIAKLQNMVVQRQNGQSDKVLIQQVTEKLVKYCRKNNVKIIYGK